MPTTAQQSLRRTEAATRAGLIEVQRSEIALDLTGSDHFESRTTLRFTANTAGATSFVDFSGRELISASLNGHPLDPASWAAGRIPLLDLQPENVLEITGVMDYSSDGEGLHRHRDPADGETYLYAMSFLNAGPRWFACFDQPDLKSRYVFDVLAPADWTVLGNGPSTQTRREERVRQWRIEPLQPMSTYFVTLVAGPYASVYAEHDGIRLGVHARASLGEHLSVEAADIFAVTAASFDYYHRMFGVRYPFGDYHQAFVPDFNAGAMENPGCVTFRDEFIYRARATTAERASRAAVIAHEMAHMWFGDLVTMRWWDDLWLNESFAEYLAHRCCSEAAGYPVWTEFGIARKDWGAIADQSPSTHPVAGSGAADAQAALQDFDGISYAKGAAVLRQLASYLGDDVFFAGLRRHFADHAYGNATFADLMAAWAGAGAPDLGPWAQGWLRTAGMDMLAASRIGSELVLTRRTPEVHPAERVHVIEVASFAADGTEVGRTVARVGDAAVTVVLPGAARLVVPDAGDETWAKIRLDAESIAALPAVLPRMSDTAARVVVFNALRDAVRDADVDPAFVLDVLCRAMPTEPADVVVSALLRYAHDQLAGRFSAPPLRAERVAQVHRCAVALLEAAAPGSDRQLVAFRLAIRSSADPDRLRSWLAGRGLPAGVVGDPELDWAMVQRLSVLTDAPEEIERALAADRSSSAAVHAARARASLPTRAAKEAAWTLLTAPSDASAYELYATADGFFPPSQFELTAPYVDRYFADVPGTASFRAGWVLAEVAARLFPVASAEPGALASAELVLSTTDLPSGLRRALVDGTDGLRRAVAVVQRFG